MFQIIKSCNYKCYFPKVTLKLPKANQEHTEVPSNIQTPFLHIPTSCVMAVFLHTATPKAQQSWYLNSSRLASLPRHSHHVLKTVAYQSVEQTRVKALIQPPFLSPAESGYYDVTPFRCGEHLMSLESTQECQIRHRLPKSQQVAMEHGLKEFELLELWTLLREAKKKSIMCASHKCKQLMLQTLRLSVYFAFPAQGMIAECFWSGIDIKALGTLQSTNSERIWR